MKKQNHIIIGALIFTIAIIVSIPSALAYRGNLNQRGNNYSSERHEAMQKAFENNDYASWVELMSKNDKNSKILGLINEQNFKNFSEAHKFMLEGNHKEAKKIFDELGINKNIGERKIRGMRKNFSPERHEAMQKAFENNDYASWVSIMSENDRKPKILKIINEQNFEKFSEAHKLMLEGNHEEAKKTFDELGINKNIGERKIRGMRKNFSLERD